MSGCVHPAVTQTGHSPFKSLAVLCDLCDLQKTIEERRFLYISGGKESMRCQYLFVAPLA